MLFYGLLDFLQRSVGIILIPLYTRVLSQKEYGELDIIIICSSVLCVLVDLQFIPGFSRLFYEHRDAGRGERFAGTAIVGRLIGGVAIAIVFLALGFLGHVEVGFLPSFKNNTAVWIIAVIGVPLSLAYEILLLQTRMLRRKGWFAIGALSSAFLSGALSAFFVIVFHWGIVGVIFGLVMGRFISLLLLAWGLRKEVVLCLDAKPFKELIRYTLPLIPGWWLGFGTSYVSRFIVFGQLGADENAILAVCMKIAAATGFFTAAFQTAWLPLAMAQIGKSSGEEFYIRSMRLFIAGGIFSTFFLSAFIKPVLMIFTPGSYAAVGYYFPLFAIATLVAGCGSNLQLGNQIAKTTYWISISAFIAIVINVAMLIAFTKTYGIFAAGLAWIVSFIVQDVILYVTAQRSHHIRYDKRAFLLLALGCGFLLLLAFGNYSYHISGWLFTSCVALVGIVLPVFVMVPFERKAIMEFARRRLVRCT